MLELFEAIIAQLDGQIDALAQHISFGGCADFAEYAGQSGKVNGLRQAREVILSLQDQLLDDEDINED